MSWGDTVVRAQAWRRWGAVLAVVAVLCSVPVVLNAWPARAAAVEPAVRRDRMVASADRAADLTPPDLVRRIRVRG